MQRPDEPKINGRLLHSYETDSNYKIMKHHQKKSENTIDIAEVVGKASSSHGENTYNGDKVDVEESTENSKNRNVSIQPESLQEDSLKTIDQFLGTLDHIVEQDANDENIEDELIDEGLDEVIDDDVENDVIENEFINEESEHELIEEELDNEDIDNQSECEIHNELETELHVKDDIIARNDLQSVQSNNVNEISHNDSPSNQLQDNDVDVDAENQAMEHELIDDNNIPSSSCNLFSCTSSLDEEKRRRKNLGYLGDENEIENDNPNDEDNENDDNNNDYRNNNIERDEEYEKSIRQNQDDTDLLDDSIITSEHSSSGGRSPAVNNSLSCVFVPRRSVIVHPSMFGSQDSVPTGSKSPIISTPLVIPAVMRTLASSTSPIADEDNLGEDITPRLPPAVARPLSFSSALEKAEPSESLMVLAAEAELAAVGGADEKYWEELVVRVQSLSKRMGHAGEYGGAFGATLGEGNALPSLTSNVNTSHVGRSVWGAGYGYRGGGGYNRNVRSSIGRKSNPIASSFSCIPVVSEGSERYNHLDDDDGDDDNVFQPPNDSSPTYPTECSDQEPLEPGNHDTHTKKYQQEEDLLENKSVTKIVREEKADDNSSFASSPSRITAYVGSLLRRLTVSSSPSASLDGSRDKMKDTSETTEATKSHVGEGRNRSGSVGGSSGYAGSDHGSSHGSSGLGGSEHLQNVRTSFLHGSAVQSSAGKGGIPRPPRGPSTPLPLPVTGSDGGARIRSSSGSVFGDDISSLSSGSSRGHSTEKHSTPITNNLTSALQGMHEGNQDKQDDVWLSIAEEADHAFAGGADDNYWDMLTQKIKAAAAASAIVSPAPTMKATSTIDTSKESVLMEDSDTHDKHQTPRSKKNKNDDATVSTASKSSADSSGMHFAITYF